MNNNPDEMKPCQCGCGEMIKAYNKNGSLFYKRGHGKRGRRFPGRKKSERGQDNNAWKGGRIIDGHGYVHIRCEGHPHAHGKGQYVREHVIVMERHLGRYLKEGECVHHINGIKTDNRIENLAMMFHGKHSRHHRKEELKNGKMPFKKKAEKVS